MMTGRDIEEALNHARIGAEGDYFAGTPRYGGALRSRSPFTGFDPERDGGGYHEMCMQDLIRRTNLAVALANSNIREKAQYSLIHPMMTRDGRYPPDFQQPKTVEAFKLMDGTQLDRILQAYLLPLDLRAAIKHHHHHHPSSRSSLTSSSSSSSIITVNDARAAKLQVLYEYLGATRLLEYEKLKRILY
ncbi:MAG: hypothetical protein M1816_003578 [Peltula sp. TS41687]|nr:MAG: hypothetical protein M1816_003578 [Peltula sp. TS41687]